MVVSVRPVQDPAVRCLETREAAKSLEARGLREEMQEEGVEVLVRYY